jgi:hypothetical protein
VLPVGLFRGEDQRFYFVWWSRDSDFDRAWRAARVFRVLAYALILVGTAIILSLSWAKVPKSLLRTEAVLLLLGGVLQLLTLVLFASHYVCGGYTGCDFGAGAGLAISTAVLAFIAASIPRLPVCSLE